VLFVSLCNKQLPIFCLLSWVYWFLSRENWKL